MQTDKTAVFSTGLAGLAALSKQYSNETAILTTPELHRMSDEKFCTLCLAVIPEHTDMINAYCIRRAQLAKKNPRKGTDHIPQRQRTDIALYAEAYKKTLISYLQHAYLTKDIAALKEAFPTSFGDQQ